MLTQLVISDVAVISRAEVSLGNGFHVFTGETGAGKSLVVDSLNMALGERGSRELIRSGCKKASVEALFYLDDGNMEALKTVTGDLEGNEIVVSREIFEDGRNVCRAGGALTTVAGLKALGHFLVNIHGQHDGQRLLMQSSHIDYVDKYAENSGILQKYKHLYKEKLAIEKEISSVKTDESEKLKRLDILKYWVNEIRQAALCEGEEEELFARRNVMRNAERLLENVLKAYEALYGGEGTACELLSDALSRVQTASGYDESLSAFADTLADTLYKIQDVSGELLSYSESIDYGTDELAATEERLDLIYKLKAKYGSTIEEILLYADNAEKEIHGIELSEQREKELVLRLDEVNKELSDEAARLSQTRRSAAADMEKRVVGELCDLDMERVQFSVCITTTDFGPDGCDRVEFMVSTNPPEPLRPLVKIASGGEMSRICLALKTVLADADDADTLVFDEIDSGVSGRAAQKIGNKLRSLGERRQVICITHLPQIAARAQRHYLVEKHVSDDKSETSVALLDDEGRVYEIARMISGEEITDSAVKAARDMIVK